ARTASANHALTRRLFMAPSARSDLSGELAAERTNSEAAGQLVAKKVLHQGVRFARDSKYSTWAIFQLTPRRAKFPLRSLRRRPSAFGVRIQLIAVVSCGIMVYAWSDEISRSRRGAGLSRGRIVH